MLSPKNIRKLKNFGLEVKESKYSQDDITHLESEDCVVVIHEFGDECMAHLDTGDTPDDTLGSEGRHVVVEDNEEQMMNLVCEILDEKPARKSYISVHGDSYQIPTIPDYSSLGQP